MILMAAHFVFAGRVGGAEHMFYNLVNGFIDNGTQITLLCSRTSNLDSKFVQHVRSANVPIVENRSHTKRFISEQISALSYGLQSDALLLPNYFTPPLIPRRLGRVATVIHDFLHAEPWAAIPLARRTWQRASYRLTYTRADVIIVPSEFVRQRAHELYGPQAYEKSVTIPNPISWVRFETRSGNAPFDSRPYILSVAAQYPHKNLEVLIRAFSRLRARFPDLLLVLCGQLPTHLFGVRSPTEQVSNLIAELDLASDTVVTGYIDDSKLGALYKHASLFAFPSLFEGFGMPAVEALGFGLPTVTTRCGSLPEVTMDAAVYLDDPKHVDEWVEKLSFLLRNSSKHRLPQSTIEKIRAHYSPSRVARLYERSLLGT
jgi:glycosyltransferase involved in cell wall biosynthesis